MDHLPVEEKGRLDMLPKGGSPTRDAPCWGARAGWISLLPTLG